jgi:hypothetical protein
LRVIAPTIDAVEAQAVPLRWAKTPEFDASKDYPRALARLCLHLGIDASDVDAPTLPGSSIVPLDLVGPKGNRDKSPVTLPFPTQRSVGEDRPLRPHRYPHMLLRRRLFLLSVAMILVLVIVGVTVFMFQGFAASKSPLAAPKTLIPTPTAVYTSTPTPTPTVVPTLVPTPTTAPALIPTPKVVPTPTQAVVPTPTPVPSPGPVRLEYEAESPVNILTGIAAVVDCPNCSGGKKVWYVGSGSTLQFNKINVDISGNYSLTIYYSSAGVRSVFMNINGGIGRIINFGNTGDFATVGYMSVVIYLNKGDNNIKFYNDSAYAPDFDKIVIAA